MADTLKEYLVDIGFNVDQSGASQAQSMLSQLSQITKALSSVLQQATTSLQGVMSSASGTAGELKGLVQVMREVGASQKTVAGSSQEAASATGRFASAAQTTGSILSNVSSAAMGFGRSVASAAGNIGRQITAMRNAHKQAQSYANSLKQVNQHGRLDNMKQGVANVRELGAAMQKAYGIVKRFTNIAFAYVIGSNIKSTLTKVIQFNEGLEKSAKKLHKSVEDARAYNIALEAMGKTIGEINRDKDMKATFKNLQALGKNLALPEAAKGQKSVQGIKEALMQLKVTGNYALQWIYYRAQEIAKGPLSEIKGLMEGFSNWIGENIQPISNTVGKAFSWFTQLVSSLAQAFGGLLELILKLPDSIKVVGAAVLLVIGMITGVIKPIWVILAAIVFLIDDLITYMQGGDSLFGKFWGPMLEWVEKVKPVLEDIVKTVDSVITKIADAWKDSSSLTDFVKRLAMGDDYEPDASWKTVGEKIWDAIKSGFGAVGNWLWELLYPDGVPTDIGGDWAEIGKQIVGKISGAITGTLDLVNGIITGMTKSLTETDENGKLLAEGLSGLFNGLVDGIFSGMSSVLTSGKDLSDTLIKFLTTLFSQENLDKSVTSITEGAKSILTKLIGSMTELISGGLQIGEDWVNAGTEIASNLMDSLINAMDFDPEKIDAGSIGERLRSFAQSIITGIITLFPKLFQTTEGIVTAGAKIAASLITSIADGFAGHGGITIDASDVVDSLIGTITNAIDNGLKIGKDVITAGYKIASSIFTSISNSLKKADESDLGGKLGSAAVEIVKKLLKFPTELNGSAEINTFMTDLGQAIIDGMGALGSISGEFIGKLIGYLFSVEALTDLYNAGKSIYEMIVKGLQAGAVGITEFFGKMVDSILIELGLIDPEARAAANETGANLARAIAAGAETEMGKSEHGKNMLKLLKFGLIRAGQGDKSEDLGFTQDELATFNGMLDTSAETVEEFRDHFIDSFLDMQALVGNFASSSDFEEFWKSMFPEELKDAGSVSEIYDGIEKLMDGYDSVASMLKDKFGADYFFDTGEEFWSSLYEGLKSGDNQKLMDLLFGQTAEMFGLVAEETEKEGNKATEEAEKKYAELTEKYQDGAEEASKEIENLGKTLDEKSNSLATDGFAKEMKEGMGKAEAAVAEAGSAFTEEMLLTFSKENGATMANGFLSGITEAFDSLLTKTKEIVKSINDELKKIKNKVEIKFETPGLQTAIDKIGELAAALGGLPEKKSIEIDAKTGKGGDKAWGGVFQGETKGLTVGEDGEEVIVPVTKQNRGRNLLNYAAQRMGLTVESTDNAKKLLGGDPGIIHTPFYAHSGRGGSTTNNNMTNVSAPATINVYGSDAQSIAENVSRNQERIVLRNLKSAIV